MNFLSNPKPSTALDEAHPEQVGFSSERLDRLREAMGREIAAGRIPGAVVGIMRRGRLAMLESFGYRDAALKAPMQVDAVFSIASMTKAMTSVAALQLFEEGRLSLADPVATYLPELANLTVQHAGPDGSYVNKPATRPPTIQDLLRHTSGFSYRERGQTPAHQAHPGSSINAAIKFSKPELYVALAKTPLLYTPGTAWEYGFSTDILGHVVEAITGEPLGLTLRRRIWSPLAMADTGFDLDAETTGRYAQAFPTDPLTGQPQSIHHAKPHTMQWQSGGGGGLSTAADYLRFAEMLRRGGSLGGNMGGGIGGKSGDHRILGRKTVELMTTDHLSDMGENRIADTMDPSCAGYGFGLGVAVRRKAGIAAMAGSKGDYYWSGVYGTYFWVDPTEQMSVVFMAASPGLIRLRYRPLIRALVYQAIND
jgi:CubicO group peptidase (beta-lactamase class C family)